MQFETYIELFQQLTNKLEGALFAFYTNEAGSKIFIS